MKLGEPINSARFKRVYRLRKVRPSVSKVKVEKRKVSLDSIRSR